MLRLIRSELKKLFKSKVNVIILLLLMGCTVVQSYVVYHKDEKLIVNSNSEGWSYHDTDGHPITNNVVYYQLADKTLHQYKGVLHTALVQKQISDLQALELKYPRETIDGKRMIKMYGKDYKEFIEDASKGKYSVATIRKKLMKTNHSISYETDDDGVEGLSQNAKINVYLTNYYEEDYIRSLYENIYLGCYMIPTVKDEKSAEEGKKIEQWRSYIGEDLQPGQISEDAIQAGYSKEATWYVDKYETSSHLYDSVVGNSLFIKAISNINILTLLALAILLANSFAMEVTCKTDQIIVPTKVGNCKITIAKFGTGILIALGCIVAQFGIVFLMSNSFVPMRNLNLQYFKQAGIAIDGISQWMFTYIEIIGNAGILMSIAAISTAVLTLSISYISKNRFIVIILMLLFLISGLVLSSFFQSLWPGSVIAQFFPSQMMIFTQFFGGILNEYENFVSIFHMNGNMIAWKDIIMVTWCGICIVLVSMVMLHVKRHIRINK